MTYIIRQSTDRPPTLNQYSADNQQSTYRLIVGRYINRHVDRALVDISAVIMVDMSVDILTNTSRPTYQSSISRYVDRHIGRGLRKLHMIRQGYNRTGDAALGAQHSAKTMLNNNVKSMTQH